MGYIALEIPKLTEIPWANPGRCSLWNLKAYRNLQCSNITLRNSKAEGNPMGDIAQEIPASSKFQRNIDQGRRPIMEWIGPGPILFIMMIACQTLL